MKNIIGFYVGLVTVLVCSVFIAPWAVIGVGATALFIGAVEGIEKLCGQFINK